MEQKNKVLPLFITIPHSGEKVPDIAPWLRGLPEVTLMRDVDRFVDRLYEPALKELGLPYIKTDWHRYAADLNRIPQDVDESSVQGATEKAGVHNRGFHWTVTTFNEPLMTRPMTQETHQRLSQLIYEPFHESVRNQYQFFKDEGHADVFHLDLHSMPSVGTSMHRDPGQRRADIVVSDCKGKSSADWFVDLVIAAYARAGFKVAYNWPYFGGRVSEQYGHPERGQQAVQVEMNRDLYMDESTKQLKSEELEAIQGRLSVALRRIRDGLQDRLS